MSFVGLVLKDFLYSTNMFGWRYSRMYQVVNSMTSPSSSAKFEQDEFGWTLRTLVKLNGWITKFTGPVFTFPGSYYVIDNRSRAGLVQLSEPFDPTWHKTPDQIIGFANVRYYIYFDATKLKERLTSKRTSFSDNSPPVSPEDSQEKRGSQIMQEKRNSQEQRGSEIKRRSSLTLNPITLDALVKDARIPSKEGLAREREDFFNDTSKLMQARARQRFLIHSMSRLTSSCALTAVTVLAASTPVSKYFLDWRSEGWAASLDAVTEDMTGDGLNLLLPVLLVAADLLEFTIVSRVQHAATIDFGDISSYMFKLGNNSYFRALLLLSVMHNVVDPFFTQHSKFFFD